MITCDKCGKEITNKRELHKCYVYPQGFNVDFPMHIDLCMDCAAAFVGIENLKKYYNFYMEVDDGSVS